MHSFGLSHVAVSVGALTDALRADLLSFYGQHFGWSEIESLRRDDRLTLDIGGGDYVNVRQRPDPMRTSGYEHLGLRLASAAAVEQSWEALAADPRAVDLEPLNGGAGSNGYRAFRFRYLLPLAIEVQHFPNSG